MNTLEQKVMSTHYPIDVAALASKFSGSKTFGPLKVTYDLDIQKLELTASFSLYGHSIGHMVLNPENPTATVSDSVGIAKASASLTVDFAKKEVLYDIDVEAFGEHIVDQKGILYSWK